MKLLRGCGRSFTDGGPGKCLRDCDRSITNRGNFSEAVGTASLAGKVWATGRSITNRENVAEAAVAASLTALRRIVNWTLELLQQASLAGKSSKRLCLQLYCRNNSDRLGAASLIGTVFREVHWQGTWLRDCGRIITNRGKCCEAVGAASLTGTFWATGRSITNRSFTDRGNVWETVVAASLTGKISQKLWSLLHRQHSQELSVELWNCFNRRN